MQSEKFNGWTNRETWNIHLWLTNDEASYYRWTVAACTMDTHELAEAMEDAHEDEAVQIPLGWMSDALTAVLQAVNWLEVAQAFAPEETGENGDLNQ